MPTTIQVQESTVEMLKRIKKRTNSLSYDEVINKMVRGATKKSMSGALARKKRYSKKELLMGLRNEKDRF